MAEIKNGVVFVENSPSNSFSTIQEFAMFKMGWFNLSSTPLQLLAEELAGYRLLISY